MKNIFCFIISLFILGIVIAKLDDITDFTANIISSRPNVTVDKSNEYTYNNDYYYVKKSSDFIPYSKQDLYNIFYSILDNGYETFTFYCPSEYTLCIEDVEDLAGNQEAITDIGNFVHPYNNFTDIEVVTDTLGEVDIIVNRTYTEEMKSTINEKLDSIFDSIIPSDMDIYDKILTLHDYIIDNVTYDTEDVSDNSGNAYGALIDGKAKCAGYADAMAIALARLNVKNFKVASEKHVWNALYLGDEWTQIDLTWDDPIVEGDISITDNIRHKFYMIDTETLLSYDTEEHSFDDNVYIELR